MAQASQEAFGKPAAYMGEGGTIPFMGMLGEKFPDTQFVITGVLGPHSNAHGPNEFLHIPDRQARDHGGGAPDRGASRADGTLAGPAWAAPNASSSAAAARSAPRSPIS